jgi:hypothetical protein
MTFKRFSYLKEIVDSNGSKSVPDTEDKIEPKSSNFLLKIISQQYFSSSLM